MMTKMMLSILISLLVTGCSSMTICKGIKVKEEKEKCKKESQRRYNENMWRYDRFDRR